MTSQAEKQLNELLQAVHWHRSDLEEAERKKDARFIERCQQALRGDYAAIRRHCEETGLRVPMDIPSEAE